MSYGNDYQEELRPGIQIASKVAKEGGTLGCFARLTGDPSKIVILSNSHVLYGDVASLGSSGDGSDVGQPSVSCCLCCACRVVAENRKSAFSEVTVNVTSPFVETATGTEIDCAIALINKKRPYTNSALYGMITGTPTNGMGVAGNDAVEMVGSTSGLSKGKVLLFKTVATYEGSGTSVPDILLPKQVSGSAFEEESAGIPLPSINQMWILPDPDPADPNRPTHFCGHGDSGSVLVNSARQVVGIVSRASRVTDEKRAILNELLVSPLPPHAGTLGIASAIAPVLRILGIEIVNNMHGTVTSAGASIEELREAEAEREAEKVLQRTLRDLEAEVRSKALGAVAMAALDRHRDEVIRLVNTHRRVAVTWRRNSGPAWAAHCLHSVRDHDYVIPQSVDGVTPDMLIERMAAVLRRFGSAELRADLSAYQGIALDWVVDCTSVWQLVDRMRMLPGERYTRGSAVSGGGVA
ncbi:MAG: hypothetical protein M3406_14550 [Chloroflexota bacterium]|nr:hypothetical protein [Chloroflexota bacterium]